MLGMIQIVDEDLKLPVVVLEEEKHDEEQQETRPGILCACMC